MSSAAADETIKGTGEQLERRRELFFAVVDFIREQGVTSRKELIQEFYPEDDNPEDSIGYSNPDSWYKNNILSGLYELEEHTEEFSRSGGGHSMKLRYQSGD